MPENKKEIVIAVTASIAIYKTCDLVRNLTKRNYPVQVLMTKNATKLIQPIVFEALTSKKVLVEEFEVGMSHIDVKNKASILAVVPATADIIGKLANGIADDLITSTYLSSICPILIAPSMNPGMFQKKVVQRNIQTLVNDGVIVVSPQNGEAVCGDVGYGKMALVSEIEEKIISILGK